MRHWSSERPWLFPSRSTTNSQPAEEFTGGVQYVCRDCVFMLNCDEIDDEPVPKMRNARINRDTTAPVAR